MASQDLVRSERASKPTFLDLSLNVRQEIYRYSLVKWRIFVGPFITSRYTDCPERRERDSGANLALVRTCKQVHEEAMPIYLSENIFVLTQIDAVAAARLQYPRVYANLQQIRNVELIFDIADYTTLSEFIMTEIPRLIAEIEATAGKSRLKRKTLRAYQDMHDRFNLPSPTSSDLTRADERKVHERHIANLREFLWGRTVTFVKQAFQLDCLYVDFTDARCPRRCCRFAHEVMRWGWCFIWLHGIPGIYPLGLDEDESEAIKKAFHGRDERKWFSRSRVYDAGRVVDGKGNMKREDLLRQVCGQIIGNKVKK